MLSPSPSSVTLRRLSGSHALIARPVARRLNRRNALPLSLALLALLIAGDALNGIEITFTLLYLFPIGLGTWFRGRAFGYLLSAIAAAGAGLATVLSGGRLLVVLWNGVGGVGVFFVFSWLLDSTHRYVQREERELRLALDQLRHGERLQVLGTLAAGVAHELGTPLNVIGGVSEVLLARTLPADKQREMLSMLRTQTERMTHIVRQLLDFGRRGGMARVDVDLAALLRDAVELLTPLVRKHGCTVELRLTAEMVRGQLARSEIEQVLCNLIVNAVQAMPRGGQVAVRLDVVRDGSQPLAHIVVADSGTGIDPAHLERIFDPFFTTKPTGEGTGLGLSVSYGIVRDHGGRILVDSVVGRGTVFTVVLPLI